MKTYKFMEQKVKDLTIEELIVVGRIKIKELEKELNEVAKVKIKTVEPEKELTVVEEMKNFPERYETLTSDFEWEDFVSFYGQKIKILCKKWNYCGLNDKLYSICKAGQYHEIIRRKKQ